MMFQHQGGNFCGKVAPQGMASIRGMSYMAYMVHVWEMFCTICHHAFIGRASETEERIRRGARRRRYVKAYRPGMLTA